jgi:hypothetical protein
MRFAFRTRIAYQPSLRTKLPTQTERLRLSQSLPAFSAARAIPDLATLIFSAYCSGILVEFHPPACVIAGAGARA